MIGLVPQSPSLLPNLNVYQNISLPLEIKGLENDKKVDGVLKLVGLYKYKYLYPYQLSGGMKQRVSIARALVYNPHLLLMDEPFASLDEILREKLNLELLKIQRKTKQTIVFVTHNIEEAIFISDKVIVLDNGAIIKEYSVNLPRNRNEKLKNTTEFFKDLTTVRNILRKCNV